MRYAVYLDLTQWITGKIDKTLGKWNVDIETGDENVDEEN